MLSSFDLVGKSLPRNGISHAERQYLLEGVRKPMCAEEIARAVPNLPVAARIYAASLLACCSPEARHLL